MMETRTPEHWICDGYDVHLVFEAHQLDEAKVLFEQFIAFVESADIVHKRAKIFERPVGPWSTPMWQIILPNTPNSELDLGRCIAWLMLNHGRFSVMVHPNTRSEDGLGGALEDHSQNMLWFGTPQPLLLDVLK